MIASKLCSKTGFIDTRKFENITRDRRPGICSHGSTSEGQYADSQMPWPESFQGG